MSTIFRSRINNSATGPSCLILYLSLGLRVCDPFFHCTSAPTLDISQWRVVVASSTASRFFSPSLKRTGRAEKVATRTEFKGKHEGQRDGNHRTSYKHGSPTTQTQQKKNLWIGRTWCAFFVKLSGRMHWEDK